MQQSVRRQVEPASARADALEHEALRVRQVRQGVRPQVLPVQARGVVLHEAEPQQRGEQLLQQRRLGASVAALRRRHRRVQPAAARTIHPSGTPHAGSQPRHRRVTPQLVPGLTFFVNYECAREREVRLSGHRGTVGPLRVFLNLYIVFVSMT